MKTDIHVHHEIDRKDVPARTGYRRFLSALLWLALSIGLTVSIFSLIDEMCLATACSDAASYTFFGIGLAWIGIAYFSLMVLLLWLRQKVCMLDRVLSVMLFSGLGAELRLLWIQKYVIGSWCPLCVTICCALFLAASVKLAEKTREEGTSRIARKNLFGWLALMAAMIAVGLVIAVAGVQALAS